MWPNLKFPADLVTFTEEILNGKLLFLCHVRIRVLKIFRDCVSRPVALSFCDCLEAGVFPWEWKKGNIVPINKKDDKTLKTFGPFPYFLFVRKSLKNWYKEVFTFIIANKLVSSNQFGFKPCDLSFNLLLTITHEIYESLGIGMEFIGLDVLRDFLDRRKQRVALNDQVSGLLQGSVFCLGSLYTLVTYHQEHV